MKAKTLPCIHSYKDLPKKLTSYASSTHKLMISGLIMLYATHKAIWLINLLIMRDFGLFLNQNTSDIVFLLFSAQQNVQSIG